MSGGLHSLATIIKRLEAATSRIEDIAAAKGLPSAEFNEASTGSAPSAPRAPPQPSVASRPTEVPRSVTAYDENVIEGKLKPFIALTAELGSATTTEIVAKFEKLYKTQRLFLHRAALCRKPDQQTVDSFLQQVQPDIQDVQNFKESSRKERDFFNHLNVVSEGAISVAWLATPKPGPHINEVKDTVNYHGNRIIKEFKEKNPKHVEWVRAFTAVLEELRKYVVEFHTTGVTWNTQGIAVEAYSASSTSAGAPPPAPGPPPPPPPPPAAIPSATASGGGAAAVFAEINRGEDVTKGLRKVDKSEMTHKNPELRKQGGVPERSPSTSSLNKKPVRPSKPAALAGKKPAKLALEGSKWAIEYQENEKSLILDEVQINHSVNIFGCKGSTIIVKGKVNAVTIVNSPKTQVLVESVVSSISVTNSPSFVLQVTGKAPMIQIDSTDSGQVYISKDSLDVEITTAKCSALNISIPVEGEEDGVFEEQPVPEMLKTVIQNGKLVTTTVEHMG
ncbi:adenylate cyclase associated N terminal-domain-containing protein [Flagelloscypha sp. PMI_526]|nr:adenylate cyclase associated N terminal-domain-containing protein [Flagelloscypha sp. PMI_526]